MKEMLKSNKFLQQGVFIAVILMVLVYVSVFFWQMTRLVAVLEYNRTSASTDDTLQYVETFEVLDTGNINIYLEDGTEYKDTEAEIVFISDNDIGEAYYNVEENIIIMELTDNYWFDILKGNNYLIVLGATAFIVVYFGIMRRKDWVYFSKKHVLGVAIGVFVLVVLEGLFAWLMF
jgi:hypothetical protein